MFIFSALHYTKDLITPLLLHHPLTFPHIYRYYYTRLIRITYNKRISIRTYSGYPPIKDSSERYTSAQINLINSAEIFTYLNPYHYSTLSFKNLFILNTSPPIPPPGEAYTYIFGKQKPIWTTLKSGMFVLGLCKRLIVL